MRARLARKLVMVSRSTTTSASMRPRALASARIPRSPVTRTPMRSASRLALRSSMRHKAEGSKARQIASRSPRPSARLVPLDSGLRTSSQLEGAAIQVFDCIRACPGPEAPRRPLAGSRPDRRWREGLPPPRSTRGNSRAKCPRRRSFRKCALECFTVPLKIIDRVKERYLSLLEQLVGFNA